MCYEGEVCVLRGRCVCSGGGCSEGKVCVLRGHVCSEGNMCGMMGKCGF